MKRFKSDLVQVRWVGTPKVSKEIVNSVAEQFIAELTKKSTYFAKSSPRELLKTFIKGAGKVLQLAPSNVAVQVTSTPSIYMKAEFENQNLHVGLIFSEDSGKFEEAVVNIFSNKTQKLNVFGSLEEVFSEVQNYFEPVQVMVTKYEKV